MNCKFCANNLIIIDSDVEYVKYSCWDCIYKYYDFSDGSFIETFRFGNDNFKVWGTITKARTSFSVYRFKQEDILTIDLDFALKWDNIDKLIEKGLSYNILK